MKKIIVFLLQLISISLLGQNKQPNVLFVIFDDLNDFPEPFGGNSQSITPNMDRLSQMGVTFVNAASNAPLSAPSRASLLSGLYPSTTGYFDAAYANELRWKWRQFPALRDAKTMMEHFRDNGYNVYGTGKIFHNGEEDWRVWMDETGKMQFGHFPSWGPFAWDGKKPFVPYETGHVAAVRIPHSSYPDIWYLSFFTSLDDVPNVPPDTINGTPGYKGWYELGQSFKYISEDDRDLMADEKNAEYIKGLLTKKHDKPFMICMGVNRPHEPYLAPKKYFDMFPLDKVKVAYMPEDDLSDCAPDMVNNYVQMTSKAEYYKLVKERYTMERWMQAYLACIAFADDQFGKVLTALENSPYADNTIIVLTSDNGYHTGEKSRIYKHSVWEESARIPLIIAGPGFSSGKKCFKPVSHIDIFPTLIDACDLPQRPNKGLPLDGYSMKPLLLDPENGRWKGPDVSLSMVCWPGNVNTFDSEYHFTVRSERYRYILSNQGYEELYDHEVDPNEWKNLVSDKKYRDVKNTMRKQMEDIVNIQETKVMMKKLIANEKKSIK